MADKSQEGRSMIKPITVVGGGLAGMSLGIGLRRLGVPVTVFESGRYPRHRVCGEFVSGSGRTVLAGWGLEQKLIAAGAREASSASFFSGRSRGDFNPLPEPALCLSRYVMDAVLAHEFETLGGQLRCNQRWHDAYGEGTVRATGRRTQSVVNGWRWFGLKVHARQVQMTADLEMHLLQNGYVGLCRLADGVVNVCGLFRNRATVPDLAQNWRDWLRGDGDGPLRARLENAQFDTQSFCSVGGLSLKPQIAAAHSECCVGDAISMIAPWTGNGMSMAFESAQLAVEPLVNYSRGAMSWQQSRAEIARRCDGTFRRRLKWSRWLQEAFLRERLRTALLCVASRFPALWHALYARTRCSQITDAPPQNGDTPGNTP
jgi:menaquinone-9 beta-reductase